MLTLKRRPYSRSTRHALSFVAGLVLLGNRESKKLQKNTYLIVLDRNTLGVRYHDTIIVQIHSDDTYTLNTGGWKTVSTKSRINTWSPAGIYQEDFVWYIGNHFYYDGIKVDAWGRKSFDPAYPDARRKVA